MVLLGKNTIFVLPLPRQGRRVIFDKDYRKLEELDQVHLT